MVHAADTFALGYPDFDLADVQEALSAPHFDPARDSWVVTDPDDVVVAWATVDNPTGNGREFVEVYADPARGQVFQADLLARQLDRVSERAAERGLPALTVRCAAHAPERNWVGVLTGAGFRFVKRYIRMSRSLDGVSPVPPVLPDGVTVRAVRADEQDLRDFHRIIETTFRDTLDHAPLDFPEWRQQVLGRGEVAWDEWFVAEADGEPVGALRSSDQALDRDEGYVKQLGVLATHRGRGIGAALLAHAFARYAAKGRSRAGLGVDLTNPTAPVRLYRSVGLAETQGVDMYELEIPARR